jgi:hypothetical protein
MIFMHRAPNWLLHSCNAARIGLDLGHIVQAIVTPLLVFLLPGPGSILQRKVVRSSSRAPSRAQAALFIGTGWLCGAAIPVAWWYGLRELIYMLTALTFFWLLTYAGPVLDPLVTLNIFGLGWALTVGTWLALPEQPVAAAAGKIGSRGRGAGVFSLRTVEIMAGVIAVLLVVAAAIMIFLWLFVVYKGPPHG